MRAWLQPQFLKDDSFVLMKVHRARHMVKLELKEILTQLTVFILFSEFLQIEKK